MKSNSAQVGLKPFLQSGREGKSQPNDCADMATHGRQGQGHPGMAQRTHTDHSDPSCKPGENAPSSKEQFGVIFLTRARARRAGILQEEAARILSLCLLPLQHLSAAHNLYRTLPTVPRTPLLSGSSQGRCRLYSQDLVAVGKGYHEHDREPKPLLS